ncbi:DUF805 domain-containing protein [Maricaulis sp. CAU 1757]
MSFTEAIASGFRNWHDFESRASRSEYWWWHLFSNGLVLFGVAIGIAIFAFWAGAQAGATPGNPKEALPTAANILLAGTVLLFFIPNLSMTIRRLHDSNRTGWWYLIKFVPFGDLVLIVFMLLEGEDGENRFGPDPNVETVAWSGALA